VGDLRQLELADLARAAEVCRRPLGYAAVLAQEARADELTVRLEARDPNGQRQPQADLELEIYRSGQELNVMLSQVDNDLAPLLWQGHHAVWLNSADGQRCAPPADGASLEGLARRIRALITPGF